MARRLLTSRTGDVEEPRGCGIVGVLVMFLALGAVSSALDALQSITQSKSGSGQGPGKAAANPFDLVGNTTQTGISSAPSSGTTTGVSQISPQTMSALLAAQSQSTNAAGSTSSASSDPLQNLFSAIDGNGDGQIT